MKTKRYRRVRKDRGVSKQLWKDVYSGKQTTLR